VRQNHHCLAGLMTVPVVCLGWETARPLQLLFLLGGLTDVAFDVFDIFKKSVQIFVPSLSSKLFRGTCPISVFVIMCCMHHPLAMLMVVPMNLRYPYLEPYHQIVCALLLAAGICFLAGQYKFTLDTKTVGGFYRYKLIVLVQLELRLSTPAVAGGLQDSLLRGFSWLTLSNMLGCAAVRCFRCLVSGAN